MKQDEKGWPRCKTIKDILENVDEKEVIVATNLTSILQAAPIHSKSSPQLPSIRINVDKEWTCSQDIHKCHSVNDIGQTS